MNNILTKIIDAEAGKNHSRLTQLRQALTSHRPMSHYASLADDEAARLVELTDAALARIGKPRSQKQRSSRQVSALKLPRQVVPLDMSSMQQADLFEDSSRFPRRPYCTNDLEAGLRIRPFRQAVLHSYLSINPPHLRIWSVHDIDRADAANAWEQAGLPPPTWTAANPVNGHAHSAWGLSVPVLVNNIGARDGPIRYLCAIESMMRERLQSDPSYGGLITKNPASKSWKVQRGPNYSYTLAELAQYLPGIEKYRPKPKSEIVGLGRNVHLFDRLSKWSYRAVRNYWGGELSGRDAWMIAVNLKALEMNADLFGSNLLGGKEVWHVARSVAKWTWRNLSQTKFTDWQSVQGTKGGKASGVVRSQASEENRASARLMASQGISVREIAAELGAARSTVSIWLQG